MVIDMGQGVRTVDFTEADTGFIIHVLSPFILQKQQAFLGELPGNDILPPHRPRGDESPRDWTPVKQVIGSWVGIWPRISLPDSSPRLFSQRKMGKLSFLSGISKLGRYDSGTPSDHPAQEETFCKIKSCRGKQGWAMERELQPCWYSETSRSICIWIWLRPWISSTCLLRWLLLFGFCF